MFAIASPHLIVCSEEAEKSVQRPKRQVKKPAESLGSTFKEVVQNIRKLATEERSYEFGTTAEITLSPVQALRLSCSANPEGIEEILIGATPDLVYTYCVLPSEGVSGGGSYLSTHKGSFRQTGGAVAIGRWEVEDQEVQLRFQLTNDEETIVRSYRELGQAGKFSTIIQDWSDIVEDLEQLFPRLTAEQRVEGFVRLWTEVKYNFANFDLVPELDWENTLSEYLPKVMRDQPNAEYAQLLKRCVASLKDGHTSLISSWPGGSPTASPPVRLRSVRGKAIVTEVGNTDEIRQSGLKPGDEITHVDGRPVQQVLEQDINPFIFASTPQSRDLKAYPKILEGPKESEALLRVKTLEGAVREITLVRKAAGLYALPRPEMPPPLEYQDLGEGLSYVAINTYGTSSVVKAFDENLEQIRSSKGLIIDVRENGGGSSANGDAIIGRLIDKSIQSTHWRTPQYRAAFRAWGKKGDGEIWHDGGIGEIEPETDDPFLGPIVVLIGPRTFSAAEDFVVPLHVANRATIVGQKSGGSTGQPIMWSFPPGKISARICTKRDTYPDGREFVGVGIIPDVEVQPTVEDVISGRDVVLERGIEVLKEMIAADS